MIIPPRINVMTFNVWGPTRWDQRREALAEAVAIADPDCLVLQECTQDILDCLDAVLSGHSRIKNTDHSDKGWVTESNIYFRSAYFEKLESGFEDLEMANHPDRGLFWMRLRERQSNQDFVLGTVHMPWPGCKEETKTGMNQRTICAKLTAQKLKEITKRETEPVILGGDFNEAFHPQRILREGAFMRDVFECLDLPPPITHPVRTTAEFETSMPDMSCDWIMIRNCKCIAAFAKTIRGSIIPSDHLPVQAVIELIAD